MKLTEKILAGIILLALLMKFNLVAFGNPLLVLSISAMMCLYFYFGFALFNGIRLRKVFRKETYAEVSGKKITGAVFTGFGLATLLTGIMFKLMDWPGGNANLIVGLVACIVISIIAVIRFLQKKEEYYKGVLIRTGTLISIGFLLFFTPNLALVKLQYRNHPMYVKAYGDYKRNPGNEEFEKKLDLEHMRAVLSPEDFRSYEEFLKNPGP
jgi:hypothetical protein